MIFSSNQTDIQWMYYILCTVYLNLPTGGMVRWLKKSSKETCFTWSHMHEKSRWLNFKMAQILDHVPFCWDGSLFGPRKIEMTRDRDFERFWNWAISISHAYDFTWDMSPSMTFWAISPYPSYLDLSPFKLDELTLFPNVTRKPYIHDALFLSTF